MEAAGRGVVRNADSCVGKLYPDDAEAAAVRATGGLPETRQVQRGQMSAGQELVRARQSAFAIDAFEQAGFVAQRQSFLG